MIFYFYNDIFLYDGDCVCLLDCREMMSDYNSGMIDYYSV